MMRDVQAASAAPTSEARVGSVDSAGQLSADIEAALETLGRALLEHPQNEALRQQLRAPGSAEGYLEELLGLVFRCVFLRCMEARGAVPAPGSALEARERYARLYGGEALARARPRQGTSSRLWSRLQTLFRRLERGDPRLGLPALGGVFARQRCPRLDAAQLDDRSLLRALQQLSGQAPPEQCRSGQGLPGQRPRGAGASFRDLTPEQLGGAYESLLALRPRLGMSGGRPCWTLRDEQAAGLRRSTGSYYTPEHLVRSLLDAALEPVVAQALRSEPERPAEALLKLAVVDPACGTGYFLLAAARRLAQHLARHSAPHSAACAATPGAAPEDPAAYPDALARVVQHCLFGVDLNPMAVELCRFALWLEVADAGTIPNAFEGRILQGNALLGATPEQLRGGVPDAAWAAAPGADRRAARVLERRNQAARTQPEGGAGAGRETQAHADAWCAAFFWPEQQPAPAPTNEVWLPARAAAAELPRATAVAVAELAREHHFLHWHLAFPDVFARGGFDLVLGNPPWIAHAGRAAQRLPPPVKHFFGCNYEAFAEYPTTHGVFVQVAAGVLRDGGYLGLVIPSSLSELGGYAPTRAAHDRLCEFPAELVDFGEGQFPGVTQPCMALVSRRAQAGRRDAAVGQPWPVQRNDLDAIGRGLLARLGAWEALPAELFGERGVQSDKQLLEHFRSTDRVAGRFDTPIREGTDVREFELCSPRWHVDRSALGSRMRGAEEFARVRVLVRQTARYPIAALSDGVAFRNSLLAVFESPTWPAPALVALLNSSLIRWLHYMRFRDARQPILPQLKIGHLRALPAPQGRASARRLQRVGERCSSARASDPRLRRELDELVFSLYELDRPERELVARWHAEQGPRPRQPSASASS